MLSCGALERSNNPYIESIMEPCVYQNQTEILGNEAMGKSIQEFVYLSLCETEKKNNNFEITVIIFKAYKKCKSPIQKLF